MRGGAYTNLMKAIFREEGVPDDLVYMAQVESAFKAHAYSRAKAKGFWQFIAGTARRYGLRRDWWIDERSDFERSTRAAASYLRDLHEMFGDWYLAMAAYNAGEGKIQRALRRTGKDTFWEIAKTRELRLETKNYVPAILATIVIAKSPEKFGFTADPAPALNYDRVVLDEAMDLRVAARCAGTTVEILRDLNPALYRLQTPPDYPNFTLNLPAGAGPAFEIVAMSRPDSERFMTVRPSVRKGATLAAVARRYGVSASALAGANGLSTRSKLRAGATLTIPSSQALIASGHPDAPGSTETSRSSRTSTASRKKTTVYKVVRGDTLYSIARKFGTSVDSLRSMNKLSSRSTIMAGQRLMIRPTGSSTTRAAATTAKSGSKSSSGGSGGAFPYTVRKGDTLARIAAVHGTSVDSICKWNGLSRSAILRVGARLTLYR
jgi:membrane-bound lytic murein transglycosylase D